jgi:choline monooxygenase
MANQELKLNMSPRAYVERDFFAAERNAIFWRTWQIIGSQSSLTKRGDYIATDIAGAQIFVIRDASDNLRAFRNVCRHRGSPLFDCGAGNTKSIRCPYHNWIYGLDGRLERVPDFEDGDELDLDQWNLHPVQVDTWGGLVFVAIEPDESLNTQLGATIDELSAEPMESATLVATERLVFNANWKIYTDNFVEGYHIPGIHPAFFRGIDFSKFETTAHDGLVRMTAPAADELFYRGRWLWMWPNWTLSLYPDGFNTSRINPISESRTELLYHFYFQNAEKGQDVDSGQNAEARDQEAYADTIARNMAVIREDFGICERIHRNFESGAYEPGPLSPKHETGVAYFQDRVQRTLARHAQP